MIELITQNWFIFLIALIFGLATGWWIWARYERANETETRRIEPKAQPVPQPIPAPAPAPAPIRDELKVDNLEKAEANPIAAAAPVAAPVAVTAEPESKPKIAAAVGAPDDLRQIKGVGPKLNGLLNSIGVTRFDQISAWGDSDIAEVDGYLGSFKGRITRDNWVDQAGYLAKGDIAGFEGKYGKMLKN
jgi:predicted flap endonuclease-1-like 5' DNA nuclease